MEWIGLFLEQYGMGAIFFVIALEYGCFPLPSEVVLPLSGAFAAREQISLWVVYGMSIVAGLVGSSICYWLGRWGGEKILHMIVRVFPKAHSPLVASQTTFEQYANLAVAIARVFPICRTYISLIAGGAKQNYLSFLGYSAIGIGCWNLILLGAGYILGEHWEEVAMYYEQCRLYFLLGMIVVFIFLGRMYWKSKRI